ncbi:MAG: hypothetical protein ABIP57_07510 [Jatrophihabitantaceae bacterium]
MSQQWGGHTPKANVRLLDGQLWDQMPALAEPQKPVAAASHPSGS